MSLQPPTCEQTSLAEKLGISLEGDTFGIAAARLLDKVARALDYKPSQPSSERQISFAKSIGCDVSTDSKRVASAKIGDALYAKNQEILGILNIKSGDRVIRIEKFYFQGKAENIEEEFIVSSIKPDGRVFFKGGKGQGAWPDQLRKIEIGL